MALHRTRLAAYAWALTLAMAAGASAETLNDTSTTASTSSSSTTTTMTMQQLQGKNLLWLSASMTSCPSGTTLVYVRTSTGTKKACVSDSSTSTGSTSATPQ
ncbi:MAG TPA: hypothetical protein VMU01_11465 [Rhizomicrobium sp.]|nr:hypothetical protein [Rhizomicrobium sp.]